MQLFMLELAVSDWHRSCEWYRQLLQREPSLIDDRNAFALFDLSGCKLALKQSKLISHLIRVVFQVTDLAEEEVRIRNLGWDWHEAPKRSDEGYLQATLCDPDGHRVAIFQWL